MITFLSEFCTFMVTGLIQISAGVIHLWFKNLICEAEYLNSLMVLNLVKTLTFPTPSLPQQEALRSNETSPNSFNLTTFVHILLKDEKSGHYLRNG